MRDTCFGSVRGHCGITHRSLRTAIKCVRSDGDGCATQGGYSDRTVMIVDEDESVRKLTDEEFLNMTETRKHLDSIGDG